MIIKELKMINYIIKLINTKIFAYKMRKKIKNHPQLSQVFSNVKFKVEVPGTERKTRFYKVLVSPLAILEHDFSLGNTTKEEIIEKLEILKAVKEEHYKALLDEDFTEDDYENRRSEIGLLALKVGCLMMDAGLEGDCKTFIGAVKNMPEFINYNPPQLMTEEELSQYLG